MTKVRYPITLFFGKLLIRGLPVCSKMFKLSSVTDNCLLESAIERQYSLCKDVAIIIGQTHNPNIYILETDYC